MVFFFYRKRRNERYVLLEVCKDTTVVPLEPKQISFFLPYGAVNLLCAIGNNDRFLIANNCARWRCNFIVTHRMAGGSRIFLKTSALSTVKEDWYTLSQILLAGEHF